MKIICSRSQVGDYMQRRFGSEIGKFSRTEGSVLIAGETGVGKESIAHAIYQASRHSNKTLRLADLLGSPDNGGEPVGPASDAGESAVTESQRRLFFGTEERSPDGDTQITPGFLQLTDEGTLLIQGADRLTPAVQTELLEALKTGTYRRIGGAGIKNAKVRIIATTRIAPADIGFVQHPLLYTLLHERSIVIPPLRKRYREIPALVNEFIAQYTRETGRKIQKLPAETLEALVNYDWPGNDMELSNTLKRSVLVSGDGIIRPQDIYYDLTRIEEKGKINLLRYDPLKRALSSPLYPAVFQSAATPFFFITLIFLFLGTGDPARNPASLFDWALGWPLLIISTFFFARFWCSVCPIGTIGKLVQRLFSLNRPYPAFLKNWSDFVLAGAVLAIFWVETATGIRDSPLKLGILIVAMLVSAMLASMIYERQTWCLYLCGLGGMVGLLAKTSILELRADRNICVSRCGTHDCYIGGVESEGCPFSQAGPRLHSNRLCKLCGTCVKNCPYDAISLNLRFPGREIWEIRQPMTGTAFLVLGMIGGLISEMSTKTPGYGFFLEHFPDANMAAFTILFVTIILLINLIAVMASLISSKALDERLADNYSRYGLALLPLALTIFGAFHLYYLVHLGVHVSALLSQDFGLEVFRHFSVTIPDEWNALIQQCLIWMGLFGTFFVLYRIGRENYTINPRAFVGLLPHAVLALAITVQSIDSMMFFFYGR
jgi:polyferredoxin